MLSVVELGQSEKTVLHWLCSSSASQNRRLKPSITAGTVYRIIMHLV